MIVLKRLWSGWKRVAVKIAVVQTTIILTLLYVVMIGATALVAFLFRRDFLQKRRRQLPTFWNHLEATTPDIERYKHQF